MRGIRFSGNTYTHRHTHSRPYEHGNANPHRHLYEYSLTNPCRYPYEYPYTNTHHYPNPYPHKNAYPHLDEYTIAHRDRHTLFDAHTQACPNPGAAHIHTHGTPCPNPV